ncbi:Ig-like domain-containing protein [Candidatus Eisenbacteria bacterium]|uniref:Ig-like domain-containing protein n=1 Tax=Eiseniibacteriota bacterium TaxID=2212470 RepID=A0ABV6YJ90_UNCEI
MNPQSYSLVSKARLSLVFTLVLSCFAIGAHAQISATSGDVVAVPRSDVIAAGSLVANSYTSDTEIRVFLEKGDYQLTGAMDVDVTADGAYDYPLSAGTLAAGEWVTSVMIHVDRTALFGTSHLTGTIEFSNDVLGVVLEDATLNAWDSVVGLLPVTYPTGATERGLEVDDAAWTDPDGIVLNGRIVDLDLMCSTDTDQMRVILVGASPAVTFSIDFQGPTTGTTATWGPGVIDEGDILTVAVPGPPGPNRPVPGPTDPPAVVLEPADLGINFAGMMGLIEVDALSFGKDRGRRLRFSVDEFAVGLPIGPMPNVRTEGALPGQNEEASADIFTYRGPVAPTDTTFMPGNRAVIDGNGVAPSGRPGLGLIEPNPPTVYALPDTGDNVDAFDQGTRPSHLQDRIYFSLDAEFADWAETFTAPPNVGAAAANGVNAADILVTVAGSGTFSVYASASALGLGTLGEEDDVDGIAIWDDGDGIYEPNIDRILFSLRRGSGSLYMTDCRLGLPITEADVLTPGPCILIPGESLGLDTSRGGIVSPYQVPDDLNAIDRLPAREAPVGNDDNIAVQGGGQVQIEVLDNDFPLDGQLVPESIEIITEPMYGTIEHIDHETGTITYQHDQRSLTPDSFRYIVFDDRGECTDFVTVYIAVGGSSVEEQDAMGRDPVLSVASPNPFRSRIALRLQPVQAGHARVAVIDPAGRQVRLLMDEMVAAGTSHSLTWDGHDEAGYPAAAGIYILHAQLPDGAEHLRVIKLQ